METDCYMKQPLCLLHIFPSGSLALNPEALNILSGITQSVLVVTIFGPPDTGKSYLMNRLVDQRKGFPMGSGMKPPGRRIWMWCLPHPHRDDQCVIILDIDGFETKEQGDQETETRISALALTLSSILLYNSKGTINREALDKLHFFTKLCDYVQIGSDADEGGKCPEFLWCVRDSELVLWVDGFRLIADDYLLSILTIEKDTSGSSVSHYLEKLFRKRKCFEFCHPCPDAGGKSMSEVLEGELDRDFQMQTERLRGHVLNSQAKTIMGGHKINGQMFGRLVEACVSCVSNNQMIILENLRDVVLCKKPVVELDKATVGKRVKTANQIKMERVLPLTKPSGGRALSNMEQPVCLIENSDSGELRVNQEAVSILSEISQPVVVVAIVGLYRTGKSYLMNKLARKQRGFSLGSTIQSQTKGIWMWCVPHPLNPDHCLVLLDTEGLGDVEKGDEKNDSWIFALAVLLSSMLVYNSIGTIDQYAVEKLHYITELTELIKVKSAGGDDESVEFARFFPAFVWSVRDFTLELKLAGREVTEDEYLDNALKLKPGSSKKTQVYNLPRECIRNYFPTRKCFVFDRPADKEVMKDMDQIPDCGLDPDFVRQAQVFVKYVYSMAQIKRLKGGYTVSGRLLGTLALTYVDAIRSGTIPCLESTVHTLAQIENTAAVSEAVKAYEEMMGEQVRLPTETVKELSEIHNRCQSQALQLFMKRCFKDEGQKYQQEFMNGVAEIYSTMCKKNCQESVDKSTSIILELGAVMKDKIKKGSYTKPGGYAEYEQDMEALVEQYRATQGKGIQAEQVLQNFQDSQKQLSESLRQVDVNMTAREKELAAARERAELAEQERKGKEEERRAAQQLLEDQKLAMEENLTQLRKKAEQDQLNLAQEHQKVLEQRLLEQQKLQQEGFQSRAGEMQQEIDSLKKQQTDTESPSIVDMVLDTAILTAPGYYKAIPIGIKLVKNLWGKLF
ncbi:guanylate-binding protein 1-like [Heterodontus francisci]|uniref:guanylate-binding protein 1-like n=1 Tax=Heterodontus francisci TaxID=7792 RepID=UPI00355B8EAF